MNFPINSNAAGYNLVGSVRNGTVLATSTENRIIYQITLSSHNNATDPSLYCGNELLAIIYSSGNVTTYTYKPCTSAIYLKKLDNNNAFGAIIYSTGTPDWNTTNASSSVTVFGAENTFLLPFLLFWTFLAVIYFWLRLYKYGNSPT